MARPYRHIRRLQWTDILEDVHEQDPQSARWLEGVPTTLSRLAPGATRVGVAVSGGADSIGLLVVLADVADVQVTVLHVDHAMREASRDDQDFVQGVAERFGMPYAAQRIDVPALAAKRRANLEAVAREVRYATLTRLAKEAGLDVVATAHTLDDQAETVLMQVLRGSVRPAGIRPRHGRIVRPLLQVPRELVRTELMRRGVTWREDETNRDLSKERAWLRHEVLPRLEKRRPGTAARLARLASAQADVAEFLDSDVTRRFGARPLRRTALAAAPVAVQREALARRVREAGGSPHQEHLDRALEALSSATVTQFDVPGPARLRLGRDEVDVVPGATIRGRTPRTSGPTAVGTGDVETPALGVDERWMERALALADRAAAAGEVPIGAVVVADGAIVGEGWNVREAASDPIRHAEIEALRHAATATGSWRLAGATLYVTLEPCPMCAGAILQTHLARVVFGAYNARDGAFGSVVDLATGAWKRVPVIDGGVAERACRAVLERFFAQRRACAGPR